MESTSKQKSQDLQKNKFRWSAGDVTIKKEKPDDKQ